MAEYRVHKSNMPQDTTGGSGGVLSVSSNADGVTVRKFAFCDLPLVHDAAGNVIGRQCSVITDIKLDSDDAEWVILTTQDATLPLDPQGVQRDDEGDWEQAK